MSDAFEADVICRMAMEDAAPDLGTKWFWRTYEKSLNTYLGTINLQDFERYFVVWQAKYEEKLDVALNAALKGEPSEERPPIDDPDLPEIDLTYYVGGFSALPSGTKRTWGYVQTVPAGWRVVSGEEPYLIIEKE